MSKRYILAFILLLLPAFAFSQDPNPKQDQVKSQEVAQPVPVTPEITAYIKAQFGSALKPDPKYGYLVGDLDGDGNEDIVVVVSGQNPLVNQAGFGYKVVDPYNAYWGWSDPKMTLSFPSIDAGAAHYLAIAHGWKLPKPVAKYVIVNVPFQTVYLGSFTVKKKNVNAVIAREAGGITAAIFFDGKKYHWEAFGSD